MIAYFGEVMKMCANITYFMMTLNRYLLVGKDHPSWLVTFAKLEIKWVIRVSLIMSSLINIGHGWEYLAVTHLAILDSNENKTQYNIINGYSYSDYPQANQETFYFAYSIIYFVINFGAFFLLNTCIEVKIVRRMHKELKDKRERMAQLNATNSSKSTSIGKVEIAGTSRTLTDDKKKETEDEQKERRVIKMVILNGVFNFLLRAPDMLFWLENNMTWSIFTLRQKSRYATLNLNDNAPGIFNLIADIGYLTYLLTFSTNFFIFYKFNKNFNKSVVFFWSLNKEKKLVLKK
jgi:hypothetical protein